MIPGGVQSYGFGLCPGLFYKCGLKCLVDEEVKGRQSVRERSDDVDVKVACTVISAGISFAHPVACTSDYRLFTSSIYCRYSAFFTSLVKGEGGDWRCVTLCDKEVRGGGLCDVTILYD